MVQIRQDVFIKLLIFLGAIYAITLIFIFVVAKG
jgi:hypothetical protein